MKEINDTLDSWSYQCLNNYHWVWLKSKNIYVLIVIFIWIWHHHAFALFVHWYYIVKAPNLASMAINRIYFMQCMQYLMFTIILNIGTIILKCNKVTSREDCISQNRLPFSKSMAITVQLVTFCWSVSMQDALQLMTMQFHICK